MLRNPVLVACPFSLQLPDAKTMDHNHIYANKRLYCPSWFEMTRKLIMAKSESGFSHYRPAPTYRKIILYGPTACYVVLRFFRRYKRAVGCWLLALRSI